MNKKMYERLERLEREETERESKARSESADRQGKIKVLWGLDEEQLKAGTKNPKEKQRKEQELKAQKLKGLLKSVRDLAKNDDLIDGVRDLVELVGLQGSEIDYLTQFRRDWERENLSSASSIAELQPLLNSLRAKRKANPKQTYEHTRQSYKMSSGIGWIEYEFGGVGEAEWRKTTLGGVTTGEPYQASCLDEIFVGGAIPMRNREKQLLFLGQRYGFLKPGLQLLFGMHRNRFPKDLPSFKLGSERLYDYRALLEIMKALLSENEQKSRASKRGRLGEQWPSVPAIRAHMLGGIEARLKRIASELWEIDRDKAQAWQREIADPFLAVIHPHVRYSAKK